MYYILTTIFENHWDRIRNNKTSYLKIFLEININQLKENTDTIFLRLDRKTKTQVLKAWLGKVYNISESVNEINFSVKIEKEIELEPDIIRTKIGWFIIDSNLPFANEEVVLTDLTDIKINIQEINGKWDNGYALDIHTLHSIPLPDGHFDTTRTPIGELLYKLKYCHNKTVLPDIRKYIQKFIHSEVEKKNKITSDVIIPVPPSDTSRSFQPVIEIAKLFGEELKIKIDTDYLIKTKSTSELKSIDVISEREKILKDAFKVKDDRYAKKTVLIIDDLYRSGATINEIVDILKKEGNVLKINVITLTKTRSKR